MVWTQQEHRRRHTTGRVIHRLRVELRRTREQIARDRETLVAIQRALVLQQLPRVPGLDLAVHSVQAERAGGDFYDVRQVGPHQWAIVIADVSGHGLVAAGILALVHALGNAIYDQQVLPGAALELINKPLASQYLTHTGQFVTAFVGLYDAQSRQLTYASAGHPPPRLVRGESVHRLDAVSGLPLGIDNTITYENETQALMEGDRLILFTDGITESANPAHDLYGDQRLDAVVRAPAHAATELLAHVVQSVRTFRGRQPANDDETCLVAVLHSGPDSNEDLPADAWV